jgi:sulfate adenylyltransferase
VRPPGGPGEEVEGSARAQVQAIQPPVDAPTYVPDPAVIAEARLRLTNLASTRISLTVPPQVASAAGRYGWLVLHDDEGAPLAALDLRGDAPRELGRDTRLAGHVVPLPADTTQVAGPFPDLRRTPEPRMWAGADVIIGHDPPDLPTLAATSSDASVLIVVLDGPRSRPGPAAVDVIRAARSLASRLAGHRGRRVEVCVLPAPEYGDERDADLANEIAATLRARLVVPVRPADRGRLVAALDGDGDVPADAWPAESLTAWRAWRPPRERRGVVVFFTGLSGSGKSTVARSVVATIEEEGARRVTSLDGDVVRRMLSSGLGFSREDRDLNVVRIGYVAAQIARHGGIAVCTPIAPFAATRARVRAMAEEHADFLLVHVATPLAECERRDRKGLYARARAGEIPDFTGISSPYEEPGDADLTLDTAVTTPDAAAADVVQLLRSGGWLPPPPQLTRGNVMQRA